MPRSAIRSASVSTSPLPSRLDEVLGGALLLARRRRSASARTRSSGAEPVACTLGAFQRLVRSSTVTAPRIASSASTAPPSATSALSDGADTVPCLVVEQEQQQVLGDQVAMKATVRPRRRTLLRP